MYVRQVQSKMLRAASEWSEAVPLFSLCPVNVNKCRAVNTSHKAAAAQHNIIQSYHITFRRHHTQPGVWSQECVQDEQQHDGQRVQLGLRRAADAGAEGEQPAGRAHQRPADELPPRLVQQLVRPAEGGLHPRPRGEAVLQVGRGQWCQWQSQQFDSG